MVTYMLEEQAHDEGRLIARRYRLGETVRRDGLGTLFPPPSALLGPDDATATGLGIGPPAYIAPERGWGRRTGARSGRWARGVALNARGGGRPPSEGLAPMASLVAIISEDPAPCEVAGPLWKVIDG